MSFQSMAFFHSMLSPSSIEMLCMATLVIPKFPDEIRCIEFQVIPDNSAVCFSGFDVGLQAQLNTSSSVLDFEGRPERGLAWIDF
ncbi:hypothetical protein CDAR_182301 [Caerostris darwini]|uniref:Uncharacterized protein n=1 Tax=Caerostris darwini TaxID=1538125 RepID=A0AAV4U5J1_9ARAC|nr:hypothetical protein CDAR_182301 [Caerostris darwini]